MLKLSPQQCPHRQLEDLHVLVCMPERVHFKGKLRGEEREKKGARGS